MILRESLLVPGETFDSRKLKATQQRLEGIGYFKAVNVYAVRTGDDLGLGDNYRDVYIEVEETTTGNVSLFMGFSSTDNIFGGLDLTERNFNIAGVGRLLHGEMCGLRGSGQYFHARGTLGKKENNILLSWMNPYVNDSLWRFGVELNETFSELQAKDSKIRTYGGSIFTNYPLSTYWTAGIRQRLRHTYNIMSPHHPKAAQTFESMESFNEEKERNYAKGFLSAISTNLSYDSTDSSMKPHRGWRSYLEGEMVGLGGRFHFWKFSYLNSIYFPVTAHSAFKVRGELRFIQPFGSREVMKNVPNSERFLLGGEGTVRGYKPFSIGPKFQYLETSKEGVTTLKITDTPTGGLSSCLLSAEYNYELLRMLDVFVFFDAGSVTFDTWSIQTLRCGTGAGVRLEINKGTPIVVGYGYRAFASLSEQAREHAFDRRYLALVRGEFPEDCGRINVPIGRSISDPSRMSVTGIKGREAVTRFEVLERFGRACLAALVLETGRTHQIRVHLRFAGHPVLGDPVYGSTDYSAWKHDERVASALASLHGQALHAERLGFIHPGTAQEMVFTVPPPPDFAAALDALRISGRS